MASPSWYDPHPRPKKQNARHKPEKPQRDWFDKAGLMTGIAGVAAVIVTIVYGRIDQTSNGRDVSDALAKMAAIAKATRDERGPLERQAKAAAASAEAAKATAQLVRDQTDATVSQAKALIESASATVKATSAQLRAADAQLASAQANTKTAEAGARAASEQLRTAQLIAESQQPFAMFSGLSVDDIDTSSDSRKQAIDRVKVKPVFENHGASDLFPVLTSFSLSVADVAPNVPPATPDFKFGGNETPTPHGGQFYPIEGFIYSLKRSDVDAFRTGKRYIFVWGTIEYTDSKRNLFKTCYAAIVSMPANGGSVVVTRAGPAAYHCGGG